MAKCNCKNFSKGHSDKCPVVNPLIAASQMAQAKLHTLLGNPHEWYYRSPHVRVCELCSLIEHLVDGKWEYHVLPGYNRPVGW